MTWLTSKWRTLGVATLTSVIAVGVGVAVSSSPPPEPPPLATALGLLQTDTMTVPRASFCDRVAPSAIGAALGATTVTASSWGNGDTVALTSGSGASSDIVHEFGCRWTADGRTAEAWVFAPPVTVAEAEKLVATATKTKGCTPIAGAPAFGTPSIALTCGETVSYRGLYGDAWLVCTLDAEPSVAPAGSSQAPLAERWCATVALAAQRPGSTG